MIDAGITSFNFSRNLNISFFFAAEPYILANRLDRKTTWFERPTPFLFESVWLFYLGWPRILIQV